MTLHKQKHIFITLMYEKLSIENAVHNLNGTLITRYALRGVCLSAARVTIALLRHQNGDHSTNDRYLWVCSITRVIMVILKNGQVRLDAPRVPSSMPLKL